MIRIGIDVGGTFTDLVAADEATGDARHFKLPSMPSDPAAAIADGVAELLQQCGASGEAIAFLGHGTTVVTNLIIERRGAKTALLTTAGFRDVIEIGRQTRPDLYDYTVERPPPLVPRHRRMEIPERLDAGGKVLVPLDEGAVARAAVMLKEEGVEAIAIGFLHAYRNDLHERRAGEILRGLMPDAFVALSSEVLPEFREYERLSTTIINAYAGPRMARYLAGFARDVKATGCRAAPYVFHSNGGLLAVETASRFPVRTCVSGPAAGVIGAAAIGAEAGFADLVTFDVGGTSTDVSLVEAGRPAFTAERIVAGYPVRVPMVDIQVIGAGGGSIARLDDAGALKVGPESAGADPGPAGYGRSGERATITDANLVLGRLNPTTLLGGRLPVDLAASRRVLQEQISGPLGLSLEGAAEGILRIANAGMARAIRSISTERGHDLRRFALFAYGGAGPLHAGDVARELGMPCVVVPPEPGTLCARGILHADLSFDLVQTRITPARPERWPEVAEAFAVLTRSGADILDRERVPEPDRRTIRGIEARYEGQNFEVYVALDGLAFDSDADAFDRDFGERFRAAHRTAYGYDIPGRGVEIVTLRLKMVAAVRKPKRAPMRATESNEAAPKTRRSVYFDAATGWCDTPVYDRAALSAGRQIAGPVVIEEMSATTLIHPGQNATMDAAGNLILTLG